MSGKDLQNKVVIVTGAASGFGAEIARVAAARGAKVVLTDLNEEGVKKIASAIERGQTLALKADVTKAADWQAVTQATVEKFGRIDALINNAGYSYVNKPTLTVTEAEFDRTFDINVKSIYHSSQTVVAQILKQGGGGSIVNVSSVSAMRPRPGLTWYSASKGAVTVATKALASDYASENIRFNCVSPVLSGTGLFSSFAGVPDTPENQAKFLANIPLGRLGTPADIAHTALFLITDGAKFLTGVDIPVDGGRQI